MSHRYRKHCKKKTAYMKKNGIVKCYICKSEWKGKTSLDVMRG